MSQAWLGQLATYPTFRITAQDSNKFAILADETGQSVPFVMVLEIFDVGGQTPENVHQKAFEHFYVLAGRGQAMAGNQTVALQPGDSLLVPPGLMHQIRNIGPSRLYLVTTMVPDEAFSALIRSGIPDRLDELDLHTLSAGSVLERWPFPPQGVPPAPA
jgi:mannose-6-phosphate isomerase-like protein (cupin superfamily)